MPLLYPCGFTQRYSTLWNSFLSSTLIKRSYKMTIVKWIEYINIPHLNKHQYFIFFGNGFFFLPQLLPAMFPPFPTATVLQTQAVISLALGGVGVGATPLTTILNTLYPMVLILAKTLRLHCSFSSVQCLASPRAPHQRFRKSSFHRQ